MAAGFTLRALIFFGCRVTVIKIIVREHPKKNHKKISQHACADKTLCYITHMESRWLLVEEVARRAQVSTESVRRWLRDGALKGYKIGPKLWRITEEDLSKFMEARGNGK